MYSRSEEAPPGSRVALVSRVSSQPQAKQDKLSLPLQTKALREQCHKRKWSIVHELEIGASASKPDSEYFLAIDRLVAKGDVDVILFASVDRFCRDFYEGIERLRQWPAAGVKIYFGEAAFDPEDPDRFLMSLVLLLFSNHKKAKVRQAAMMKPLYVREQGRVYLTVLPPGFAKTENQTLVHNNSVEDVKALWGVIDEVGLAEAIKSQPAKALLQQRGVKESETAEQVLIEWIHDPLYRGQIRYADEVYDWPEYAIGDQETLARLGRRYPIATRTPRGPQLDALESKLAASAKSVGLMRFLARMLVDRHVLCPDCGQAVTVNGYKTQGRHLIPQIRCACSKGSPLFTQADADRFSPSLLCLQCGAADPRQLAVRRVGIRFLITCSACGWHADVDTSPWAPRAPIQPSTAKPADGRQAQLPL